MYKAVTLACAVVVAAAAGTALGQQARWSPGGPFPVEFSDFDDLEAAPAGGPLAPDPGQVLYTEVVDGVGGPPYYPVDALDFAPTIYEQVDALASRQDAYFYEIVRNDPGYDLAVSFTQDWPRPAPNPNDDK